MSDPVPDMLPDPADARLEADLRQLGVAYRRLPAPPLTMPWDRPDRAASSAPRPRWTWWSFVPTGAALAATLLLVITARFVLRPAATQQATVIAPHDAEPAGTLDGDEELWPDAEWTGEEGESYAFISEEEEEVLLEEDEDWPLVPSPFAADLRSGDSFSLSISPFSSEFRGMGGLRMSLIDDETEDLPEEEEI